MSLLERDAITETYIDSQQIINEVISYYQIHYGADADDLRSLSSEVFLQTKQTYNRKLGSFGARLRYKLSMTFFDAIRKQCRRNNQMPQSDIDLDNITDCRNSQFQMVDLLDELSEDAKAVVGLVFDSPKDLKLALIDRESSGRGAKAAIREFLKDIGWTAARVSHTFSEITEALA